jgi:hypothetical protein
MLEVIWSRLNMLGIISSDWFGEDLSCECMSPLLFLQYNGKDDHGGIHWKLAEMKIDHQELIERPASSEWEPLFVDGAQHDFSCIMCMHNELATESELLLDIMKRYSCSLEQLIAPFVQARILSHNGNALCLLSENLNVVALPDGRFAVADNNSGRLQRWVDRFLQARKVAERQS